MSRRTVLLLGLACTIALLSGLPETAGRAAAGMEATGRLIVAGAMTALACVPPLVVCSGWMMRILSWSGKNRHARDRA